MTTRVEKYINGDLSVRDLFDEELAALDESFILDEQQQDDVLREIARRFKRHLRKKQSDDWSEEPDYDWLYSADSDPNDKDFDKYDSTR